MIQLLNPLKAVKKSPENVETGAAPLVQQGKAMKFSLSTGDKPLPGYTIKRGVGVGGFGEVYFAVNDAGKEVALKRIQRNLDIEVRGVRQCLNLKHPNLIGLYDIQFDADSQGWIVMEYVSGPSLRDLIEQHPTGMPAHDVRNWFGQIAAAVTYLHDHGIVHRDLKPANIFADEGIVKIGDYGLSKFISCSRRGGQTESVGTFHYMAPEIGKGEYGKEIDIYALGIMLYEMATGCVPFDGESSQEIIMKHLTADPDLSRVVSPVRETVAKALQKNAASRFADVRDMVRALGMELDQRYMIIDRGAASVPPVVEPVTATYASAPTAPRIHELHCFTGGAAAAATSSEDPARLHYREPLARAVHNGFLRARAFWNTSSMGPLARAVVVAVIMLFTILNLGWITALVVFAAICYLPYYIVWSILRDTKGSPTASSPAYAATQHHGNHPPVVAQAVVAKPGPAVRPAAPKPLSIKQWRVAKRKQLALAKPSVRGAELTGSWMGALVVIAVFTALATVFQMGSGAVGQPYMVGLVWSAVMAVICSWVAIALGQRWRTSEGDSAVRSFTQLTLGLAVGGIGYALSNYLMVPWSAIAVEEFSDLPAQRWRGFFAEDGTPLLPAFLAYFPLMLGLVHWWKQADPLRRSRFSLFSVVWCVLMAGVTQLIIPFPQPWGAVIFAGTSLAVQLSTPWHNPEERLEMTQASMLA